MGHAKISVLKGKCRAFFRRPVTTYKFALDLSPTLNFNDGGLARAQRHPFDENTQGRLRPLLKTCFTEAVQHDASACQAVNRQLS